MVRMYTSKDMHTWYNSCFVLLLSVMVVGGVVLFLSQDYCYLDVDDGGRE